MSEVFKLVLKFIGGYLNQPYAINNNKGTILCMLALLFVLRLDHQRFELIECTRLCVKERENERAVGRKRVGTSNRRRADTVHCF
jgi:hypothetical protein